jgi:hypothetical protein
MSRQLQKYFIVMLSLVLIAGSAVNAQNTKRGFKFLEKLDFEKAHEVFSDALSEKPGNAPALLGLMLIMADDSSSYFDIVQAWKYAKELKVSMDQLTTEELEYIGEYFYNTETRHISRPVKKKIEYAVETVEAELIKYVREENNLELVYNVMKEFPDFRYYDNVVHIRNQLEFRKYEKQNTLEGYLEFIQKFPDAAQIEKAIRYRNKLSFDNASKINTPESYRKFIAAFPDAAEVNDAVRKLHAVSFDQAKKVNTFQAMDQFMSEFPDALEVSEARVIQKQLLYEYAKKIQTLQAYNEFIRKYPEGQQYIDIFNLKSLDNGMRFLTSHPLSGNNIQWARSFEEEENDEINACLAVDSLNSYIAGGTVFRSDTGFTDAWLIKMTEDGKMIWNKYVGEGFNDELNFLAVNGNNEIIGSGYTWLGTDSASRESWVFKLGSDGTRIWSRKLGLMHIRTMCITAEGNIFLGGYVVNDSLQNLYSIVVLNEKGNRLWGRTYTGKGEIVKIEEGTDRKILLTGTHWSARIDAKGYLQWERQFKTNDSVLISAIMNKGDICYLAVRDSNKLVLFRTGADDKLLLEKELKLPEIRSGVNAVIRGNNQLITLITYEEHQSVNWISSMTGELTGSSRLPAGVFFNTLSSDKKKNLLIEACNHEIIVIKNLGLTF